MTSLYLQERPASKVLVLPLQGDVSEMLAHMSRPKDNHEAEPIGVLLARFRSRAGISQSELAARSRLSDGMIGNVERGHRNLSPATLERVAAALELTADERAAIFAARERKAHLDPQAQPEDELLEHLVAQVAENTEVIRDLAQLIRDRMLPPEEP